MSLVKGILPIIRAFQVLGHAPFGINVKTWQPIPSKTFSIWSVGLFAISLARFLYGFRFAVIVQAPIESIVGIITLASLRFIGLIFLMEAFVKRAKHIQILNKLIAIDAIFLNQLNVPIRYNIEKRQTVGFMLTVVSLVLMIIVPSAIIVFSGQNEMPLEFWIACQPAFLWSTISYVQTIIYVKLVQFRFSLLNKQLNRLIALNANGDTIQHFLDKELMINRRIQLDDVEKLMILRRIYHQLWEVSNLINECFKWSLPVNIANDFLSLVTNLYWIFLWIIDASNTRAAYAVTKILWTIVNCMNVCLLAHNCHSAVLESDATAYILHFGNYDSTQRRWITAIEHFSLQLLHQKVLFTANGLFDINYTLVFSVRDCLSALGLL